MATMLENLFLTIDFNLLKAQKTVIINLQDKKSLTEPEKEAIEGILNLIDSLQDLAVDHYGMDSEVIFNHTDEHEKLKLSLEECNKIVLAENNA